MAKKFQPEDPFANSSTHNNDVSVDDSFMRLDSEIFGSRPINSLAGELGERLKNIDIFHIEPDYAQPRRVTPSAVRQHWDGTPAGLQQMFAAWVELVEVERDSAFPMLTYLEGVESDRSRNDDSESYFEITSPEHKPGVMESALMAVVALATSIRRDGLTNPISVFPAEGGLYRLETGERRWLAFHLLYAYFPEEKSRWQQIPAREFTGFDVWRQATENNARANLNAIGKARQLAVLMIDLLSEVGTKIQPFHSFNQEREYYAQILGKPVPYGKGEQLLNAMGVSSRSALTRYRTFLELPDEIWQGADDLNLAEETLQKFAKIARERSPQEAVEQFRIMQQTVLGQNNSAAKSAAQSLDEIPHSAGTKRYFAELARLVKQAGHGKSQENEAALEALRELRRWIAEQEKRIKTYSS